jgi:tRNA uridine 5-carboxymethylaminomethyl modification enzyme
MFTSRAEYRLSLRADNADRRLTPRGIALGCVGSERRQSFGEKLQALEKARETVKTLSISPSQANRFGLVLNQDGHRRTAFELLSYTDITMARLAQIWPELHEVPAPIAAHIETDARYAVYLDRQTADVATYRRDEALALPGDIDYAAIQGLSMEIRQKLATARPRTIGQAARIDGVTPAALTLLAARVRRRKPVAGAA